MSMQSAGFGASALAHAAVRPSPHPGGEQPIPWSADALDAPGKLSQWDLAGMLAGFLLTLAITIVNAHGRVFWEDEMLGWLLLTDPSWHHMIHAWNVGADGGGFSFYVLGRGWFALFGSSHLAFRLFSSTCFGIAFVATWGALRRRYPTWIVAFATFNSFFFSPPLTTHFLEGRFYGLLVMTTALAMWLVLKLDDTPDPTPARLYVPAFLIHGLLTTSHLLGVVYSALLVAAIVLLDRMRGRRRLGLYVTMAASWLLLLPEKTSIIAAGRVGKPHFWTRPPKLADIIGAYSGFSHEILFVLIVLLLASFVVLRRTPGGIGVALRDSLHRRRAVYIATLCLLLVPLAFLAEGWVGTWLFTDRYLQPLAVGVAFVTAELCMLVAERLATPLGSRMPPALITTVRGAFSAAFGAFMLVWVFHHTAQQTPSPPDFTDALTAHMPHNLPVVAEDAFTFTELMDRQAHSGVDYRFLLDWPWAIAPGSPHFEVTQYHLMENWQRAGYFANRIENVDTFLKNHRRFLLIHDAGIHTSPNDEIVIGNPLEERLAHDPNYEFRKVFALDRVYHDGVRDTVWLACRGGCGTQPSPIVGATHCVRYAPGNVCCNDQPCMQELPRAVQNAIN